MSIRARTVVLAAAMTTGCSCDAGGGGQPWEVGEEFEVAECISDCEVAPDVGSPVEEEPPAVAEDCVDRPAPFSQLSTVGEDVVRTSLALGPGGCPHVAWAAERRMDYAFWDGERWTTETVRSPAGWENALIVDDRGVATLFAVPDDSPGTIVMRREGGAWVERETTGDRWMWGLHALSADTLVATTATQQYTGSDLAHHIATRGEQGWSWERVVDFQVVETTPPLLARDAEGRGVLGVIENKGYGPSQPESNLWIAVSADASLRGWAAERVEIGRYNQFRRAHMYEASDGVHMIAHAETWPTDEPADLVHVRLEDRESIRALDCAPGRCRVSTSGVDQTGRIHLIRGLRNDDAFDVEHAVLADGDWTYRPIGTLPSMPSDLQIDASGVAHLLLVEPTDDGRVLHYLPEE